MGRRVRTEREPHRRSRAAEDQSGARQDGFETDDGTFSVSLRARIQARFTFRTDEEATETGEPTELAAQEFQIRRQRLVLRGHALTKKLQYYIQYGFSNEDMEPDRPVPLRDAYVTWEPTRDLRLRFGQMKVPYNRQRMISSSALQFADRSLANNELNLDRDVGIYAFSKDLLGLGHRLGYSVGVFGGDGRNRLSTHHGVLYFARLEARPFGEFEDDTESDWGRSKKVRLAFAFSVARNVNTRRERSTIGDTRALGGLDYTHGAADMIFKLAGFSLQSEVMFRRAAPGMSVVSEIDDAGNLTTEYARNAWGWFAQAGQLLTENLELAARISEVHPRELTDPELKPSRETGGAVSYYWKEHALKLQADYFYLTREQTLGDAKVTTGRHQVRVQFQVYF